MDNTSDRTTFCSMVDRQTLPTSADAIIVLRNWDQKLNMERYEEGVRLLCDEKTAPILIMLYKPHTMAEAAEMFNMAMEEMWRSIVFVTHRFHSSRAMLTFTKAFSSSNIDVYCHSISLLSSSDSMFLKDEFEKIAEYQERGDIDTYASGINYLRAHSHY